MNYGLTMKDKLIIGSLFIVGCFGGSYCGCCCCREGWWGPMVGTWIGATVGGLLAMAICVITDPDETEGS